MLFLKTIKIEKKNYIKVEKNQQKDIERLLRKAKIAKDKYKVKFFAELLYSNKLIEDTNDPEKDNYYNKMIIDTMYKKFQFSQKQPLTDKENVYYVNSLIDKINRNDNIETLKINNKEISKFFEQFMPSKIAKEVLITNDTYFNYEIIKNDNLIAEDTKIIKINNKNLVDYFKENNLSLSLNEYVYDLCQCGICKCTEDIKSFLRSIKIKYRTEDIKSYMTEAKESINRAFMELVIWLKTYEKLVMYSGGKDSTAMLIKLIEEGEKIDRIIFADTGLEYPELYDYIKRVENYINREISIVKGNITFDDWFYGTWTSGTNKGIVRGFPKVLGLGCWAKRELKIKPIQRNEGKGNIIYIGIAADEKERQYREEYQHNNIFKLPLVEWGMTENDCLEFLKERNLINPLYDIFKRIGCWLCPKQGIGALKNLWLHYPELWEKLKRYEKDSPTGFKINIKLIDLERRFAKEIYYDIL